MGKVQLIDRGRGLQLSTSRITVQDLVPYFRAGCSMEEIARWLPTLTPDEISVVEEYYLQHKEELDERDRQVAAFREEQSRLQHLRFPTVEGDDQERLQRLRKALQEKRQEKNGEGHTG